MGIDNLVGKWHSEGFVSDDDWSNLGLRSRSRQRKHGGDTEEGSSSKTSRTSVSDEVMSGWMDG